MTKNSIKTSIQTITPAKAAQWLTAHINRDNRALRKTTVDYLASEIERGKWQITHQGIAFSDTGRLLDGQHRLAAIVQANKSVEMMVSTEMEEDTFQVIDCGLKRANHERIHLVNDPAQNRQMCASIRLYLAQVVTRLNVAAVSQIEDEFIKNSDHWMWAVGGLHGHNPKLNRPAIVAALMVYHLVNTPMAIEFLAGFLSGEDLKSGSPMLKLRTIALAGSAKDNSYWRAQGAMRAHLHNNSIHNLYSASEDMLGNTNGSRVVKARAEGCRKGAVKRWAKVKSA